MNKERIEEFLLNSLSKVSTMQAAKAWMDNKEIYGILWKIINENKKFVSWRAAWLFEHMAFEKPNKSISFLDDIINSLPYFKYNGQKRHMLKVIQLYEFSEEQKGKLLNICFGFLMSKNEPVAVKMHSINILYKISLSLPDIKPELVSSIKYNLPDATSGFKNAAKKILVKIQKKP